MKKLSGKDQSDFNKLAFTHSMYDQYTGMFKYLGKYYTEDELYKIYKKSKTDQHG